MIDRLPRVAFVILREDPHRALARRRRERRAAIIGWTLGLTLGTPGVLLGMSS